MSNLIRRMQRHGKAGNTEGVGRKLGTTNGTAKDLLARLAREAKRVSNG